MPDVVPADQDRLPATKSFVIIGFKAGRCQFESTRAAFVVPAHESKTRELYRLAKVKIQPSVLVLTPLCTFPPPSRLGAVALLQDTPWLTACLEGTGLGVESEPIGIVREPAVGPIRDHSIRVETRQAIALDLYVDALHDVLIPYHGLCFGGATKLIDARVVPSVKGLDEDLVIHVVRLRCVGVGVNSGLQCGGGGVKIALMSTAYEASAPES